MAKFKVIKVGKPFSIADLKSATKPRGRQPNPRDEELKLLVSEVGAGPESQVIPWELGDQKVATARLAANRIIKQLGAQVYVSTHPRVSRHASLLTSAGERTHEEQVAREATGFRAGCWRAIGSIGGGRRLRSAPSPRRARAARELNGVGAINGGRPGDPRTPGARPILRGERSARCGAGGRGEVGGACQAAPPLR